VVVGEAPREAIEIRLNKRAPGKFVLGRKPEFGKVEAPLVVQRVRIFYGRLAAVTPGVRGGRLPCLRSEDDWLVLCKLRDVRLEPAEV